MKEDGGKMAAEGHCNVGLALEESGELLQQYSVFSEQFAGYTI